MAAPSPDRQRLAELVAGLRKLERERDLLAAASHPAFQAEHAARAAVGTARAGVEVAQKAAVTHRVSTLAGVADDDHLLRLKARGVRCAKPRTSWTHAAGT